MASSAISGVGVKFQRSDTGTSSGSYSDIAEINSITGPDKSRATIDVTSLDSTGGYREFIAGFRDGGEVTLQMNFTRNTYDDMNDDFESDSLVDYRLVMSDASKTTFDFKALVTAIGLAIPLDDKITAPVTLKISGQVTMTS